MTTEENSPVASPKPEQTRESLEENCQQLIGKFVEVCLMLDGSSVRYEWHAGYGDAKVRFDKQRLMENVIDIVERKFGMHILYAYHSNKGRHYEAMAYNSPYEDTMAAVTLESFEYGIVEEMTVTVYTSYELMYETVSRRLLSVMREAEQNRIVLLEKQNTRRLYKDFFK